jgi:hypothetical protein
MGERLVKVERNRFGLHICAKPNNRMEFLSPKYHAICMYKNSADLGHYRRPNGGRALPLREAGDVLG